MLQGVLVVFEIKDEQKLLSESFPQCWFHLRPTGPILMLLPLDAPMMVVSDTWQKLFRSNIRNKVD